MRSLTSSEIRQKFLHFFVQNGHRHVPSSPLVPLKDPTLLFTNAGMVQFKDIFTGKEKASHPRAVSVQKCIRAGGKHNDLDNVGRTARHHTFFEMLGNFSFGDYFKKDAIAYAWQFLTEEIELPAERLWITVHHDDDEAFRLWQEVQGVRPQQILRLGDKDNFWAMGETGPCGPCSEIIYDRGEQYKCGGKVCALGVCDCDRWREVWNLVFMQFERDQAGNIRPLPKPSIDTGMGLERLASIIQNVGTNYDTDLFVPILEAIGEISGQPYDHGEQGFPFRVIADHVRACTFLVAEGVMPGNEGRNYVLRRILRRAARYGRVLGIAPPFLYKLVPVVAGLMGEAYPEIVERQPSIQAAIEKEERRFAVTLDQGLHLLEEMIAKLQENGTLSGDDCFRLYDTYGLPIDLILDVCSEEGVRVDQNGFEHRLEEQRQRARADREEKAGTWLSIPSEDIQELPPTIFLGYESDECQGQVLALFQQTEQGPVKVVSASAAEEVWLVLDQTTFYGEAGGQVGDTGILTGANSLARVIDTRKLGGIYLHRAKVQEGEIRPGEFLQARIDVERRAAIRRNHSATHLLHAALRQVLGTHVQQAGSLVEAERLRFDFTHSQPVTVEQITEIENRVNDQVLRGFRVITEQTDLETAREMGAMALFQEKYGERVRVVSMGDFSLELCGGTHVDNISQIGLVKIINEQGIASGVRRIEAVTGSGVLHELRKKETEIQALASKLKTQPDNLMQKIGDLMQEKDGFLIELERMRHKQILLQRDQLWQNAQTWGGVRLIAGEVEDGKSDTLRQLGDQLRAGGNPSVVILGSREGDKALFVVMASPEAVQRGVHAGKAVAEAARLAGGGGGGRPDMAQAGGKRPEMLMEAIEAAKQEVMKQLGNENSHVCN